MERKKIRVFIDLDGVVANFDEARKNHPLRHMKEYKGRADKLPNIYSDLAPIKGAIESVNILFNHPEFDCYFLSSAPWDNPDAWKHKRLWVAKYFEEKHIRKRLILTHQKHFLIGDILIDDRIANGSGKFQGSFIHFGSSEFPDWQSVIKTLQQFSSSTITNFD